MSRGSATRAPDGRPKNPPRKVQVTPRKVEQAIQAEAELAARAAEIRGEETELDAALFLKLAPLMREKIPDGFISEVSAGDGKPYPSKGIRSLQVQIDRMDAIWTQLWWGWDTNWIDPSLAEVVVWIGPSKERAFCWRIARGGMNGGSTTGNHYKGTETNAAKMAFARLGVGHEVYIGATDFDPDTDEDAAEAQGKGAAPADPQRKLPAEKVEALERAIAAAGLNEHLPAKLIQFGVDKLADLTVEQAVSIYEWAQQEVVAS